MTRRWKLIAFFLPLAGLALILPPFVRTVSNADQIFGVPLIIVYMFLVWGCLIFMAYLLQAKLPSAETKSTTNGQISNPRADD